MELNQYFASAKGTGILSTADDKGIVNAAVYATPHSMPDGLIAFIMRERKTYANISINPSACFVFIEAGQLTGKRLYLTKVKEEQNSDLLFSLRRRHNKADSKPEETRHLVYFSVDKILPLVGDGEEA